MLALTILLLGLLVMLVTVIVLFLVAGLGNLLPLVVPMIPLLVVIGSFLLGMADLLLLFGNADDRRIAKRDLTYLGITFVVSGALFWGSTFLLWNL